MNSMTQDMTRLRREVAAGREARQNLLRNLVDSRDGLRLEVAQTLEQLHLTNADLFSHAHNTRTAFVRDLAEHVRELRQAFNTDLMGARHGWRG